MKKRQISGWLAIFVVLLVFLGCSGGSDEMDNHFECSVSPPDWLLGSWEFYANTDSRWHFYSDYIEEQDGTFIENLCERAEATAQHTLVEIQEYRTHNDSVYTIVEIWRIENGTSRREFYDTFIQLDNGQMGYCSDKFLDCTPNWIFEYNKR